MLALAEVTDPEPEPEYECEPDTVAPCTCLHGCDTLVLDGHYCLACEQGECR